MRIKKAACVLAAVSVWAGALGIASAQGDPAATDEKDVKVYDFPEEVIKGGIDAPGGAVIMGDVAGSGRSLIRPRLHFIAEMIKSVESL